MKKVQPHEFGRIENLSFGRFDSDNWYVGVAESTDSNEYVQLTYHATPRGMVHELACSRIPAYVKTGRIKKTDANHLVAALIKWIKKWDEVIARLETTIDKCFPTPKPQPMVSTSTTGATHELLVTTDLLKRGFNVYRAISPNAPCDLIVEKDGKLCRLEVRTNNHKRRDGKALMPTPLKDCGRQDAYAVIAGSEINYCASPTAADGDEWAFFLRP